MNILHSFITNNRCYSNPAKITPRGIMLHSTGTPQPKARPYITQWDKKEASVCVHAIVEPTGDVYQLLPWDYKGWHCGGNGNGYLIGVEMTEPACIKYTGGSTFTSTDDDAAKAHILSVYTHTVELFAYLCKEYGILPESGILSHKEGHDAGIASNHGDPDHLFTHYPELGLSMTSFRADVYKTMQGGFSPAVARDVFNIAGTGDRPSKGFEKATRWAIERGLVQGDGYGNYGWTSAVTREQLAMILYRAFSG